MSNFFKLGKVFDKGSATSSSFKSLTEEANSFKLAGTGGFLSVVKYMVFTVLACLNFHLFYTHNPGLWGVGLGLVSTLFEACTIYFYNQQNRSAGSHKVALQMFAIIFTVISFVHGCAALYQLTSLGPSLESSIYFYSKFVAFPLLFGLMVLSVYTLHHLHWSTKVSEARAKTILSSQIGGAELITRKLELQRESEVGHAGLEAVRTKIALESQFAVALRDLAAIKNESQKAIHSITDPNLRKELLMELGMPYEGSGEATSVTMITSGPDGVHVQERGSISS